MKIDTLTTAPPDRLDDHTVTAYYLPTFMGSPTAYPLLLDVRDVDGTLTYQLHLNPEDVATLVAAVAPQTPER